ncbi:MAG: heavy metal translocating P-type ATPase, partial [Deltaproteobacteria bacterium]|nr:heavy metal translocating P-type ATPase [Deltaproteobacteria bacterium]
MQYCEICGMVHEEGHHHHHHHGLGRGSGHGPVLAANAAPRAEGGEAASEGTDGSGEDPPGPRLLGAAALPFPPAGISGSGRPVGGGAALTLLDTDGFGVTAPGPEPEPEPGLVIDFPYRRIPTEERPFLAVGSSGPSRDRTDAAGAASEARYVIPAMDCPCEEKLVRDRLEGMEGVECLAFDLGANELVVRHSLSDLSSVEEALVSIGMAPSGPGRVSAAASWAAPPFGSCALQAGGPASAPEPGAAGEASEARYVIPAMDCPYEEKLVRDRLEGMEGVEGLGFDLKANELTVRHSLASLAGVEEALHSIGMTPDGCGFGTSGSAGPGPGSVDAGTACCPACAGGPAAPLLAHARLGGTVARYVISNMDCPVEEKLIRDRLEGMEGVKGLEFNLLSRVLTVRHDLKSLGGVVDALNSIEMNPVPLEDGAEAPVAEDKTEWKKLIAASIAAGCSEAAHLFLGSLWVALALAAVAIILAGFDTYRKGWSAIRRFDLNMNALMSFAVTGAVLIGDFPEAAMVMVLFTLAEALEDRSLGRARKAISGLVESAPEMATVKGPDGTFGEAKASSVPVGSIVRVRPGEKLSLDGKVVSGASAVNEAPITGESKPAEKGPGDPVYSGTVNESGSFEYVTTEPFENSTLARILKAVEEAQATKAPIQRFVDRFAVIYTPSVFAASLLIGTLPPLLFGFPWLEWVYRALVTLVIACPCALVISTPVTIVSGLAAATRKGLLVKGGTFLEEGRKLKILAFDKTGTVTMGRPALTDAEPRGGASYEELRLFGGSLAFRSDHPVSRAVFQGLGLDHNGVLDVEGFRALPGEGSAGTVAGREMYLGNLRLARRMGVSGPELEGTVRRLESQGKSAVALFEPGRVLGVFAAEDELRPESREAIEELGRMGVETVMLTGDNESAAASVAAKVGGLGYRSGLLPEDKLGIVRELGARGLVGMAGDGINDAPALAEAHIGFSMGAAGTGAAIETSDVAIMDDDLRKIPAFIRLSRETAWHLWENISFSLL